MDDSIVALFTETVLANFFSLGNINIFKLLGQELSNSIHKHDGAVCISAIVCQKKIAVSSRHVPPVDL